MEDCRQAPGLDGRQRTIAVLGGNQHRISGDSNIGAPIVLDRVGDKGLMDQLEAAHKASGCYYLGFTNTCADDGQLAKPTVPTDGSGAQVNVLVNLTARAQARDDADAIGIVPANTCVETNACVETADGVWCRAQFKDRSGWLRKLALRQGRWAVITFVNQCPAR